MFTSKIYDNDSSEFKDVYKNLSLRVQATCVLNLGNSTQGFIQDFELGGGRGGGGGGGGNRVVAG